MFQENYILNLLNIKDKNIHLYKKFVVDDYRKGKKCKIIEGYLSYIPKFCDKCGCVFESKDDYEKKGFSNKPSYIVIPSICKMDSYLKLNKQRIKCHHCGSSFTCSTSLVDSGCYISNTTKHSIAVDLIKKRSEKDIAIDNNVSCNTVERVMDSYYKTKKLYKNYLPDVLSFDEFKSVKSADGSMSFHLCNGRTGQTIDIVEDRRLNSLVDYFSYYSRKCSLMLKLLLINFILFNLYLDLLIKLESMQ